MEVYIFIIIIFWILMGLQAAAPYVSTGVLAPLPQWGRLVAIFLFILLGPAIAICNIVNVILAYLTGGDDDEVP